MSSANKFTDDWSFPQASSGKSGKGNRMNVPAPSKTSQRKNKTSAKKSSSVSITKVLPTQPGSFLNRTSVDSQGRSITSNTREVHYSCTSYFDHTGSIENPISSIFFGNKQSFGGNATGEAGNNDSTFGRIVKVEAWVLPRASNASVAVSSFLVATSVPVKIPDAGNTDNSAHSTLCNRNVLIKPTFNVRWIKVVSYSVDRVFTGSVVQPYIVLDATTVDTKQCVFNLSAVDPDNTKVITEPIQVMYTVTYAQPLIPVQRVKTEAYPSTNWTKPGQIATSISEKFSQVEIVGFRNKY